MLSMSLKILGRNTKLILPRYLPVWLKWEITSEVRYGQLRHGAHGDELLRPIVKPPPEQQHQRKTVSDREHFDGPSPERRKGRLKIRFAHLPTEPSAQFLGALPCHQETSKLLQH